MGKKHHRYCTCPKCLRVAKTTRHHLHPKRHYGGSGPIVEICDDCHKNLEIFIAEMEIGRKKFTGTMKLTKKEYESLYNLWLTKD